MTDVFVYGPEIDPVVMRNEYAPFVTRTPALLAGFRLCFNVPDITAPGAGCANIIGDPKDTVPGVVYAIDPDDVQLLDRRHGVADGRYVRVVLSVTTADGAVMRAETYVGDTRVYHDALQPTVETVERMLAQRDVGDGEYRDRLRALTTLHA